MRRFLSGGREQILSFSVDDITGKERDITVVKKIDMEI